MLYFLATVALCIFIGERLWHYVSAWRLHRAVRRSLQWPPPEPARPRTERAAFAVMVALATVTLVITIAVVLRMALLA